MNDAASVLIVDDEPSIRLMFHTALESAGYIAEEAVTVRRRWRNFKSRRPMWSCWI